LIMSIHERSKVIIGDQKLSRSSARHSEPPHRHAELAKHLNHRKSPVIYGEILRIRSE
jgi:hypothetical protein